jgi:hypothetical protein
VFITRLAHPEFLYETAENVGGGEQAPEEQGTPDSGQQAAAAQQQAEVDWQKRYGDLQPEYTRATQEAAALRQREENYKALLYADDQDTRRQAAQALGIELADEEIDDTQYADPTDQLRRELEQLKQQFTGDLSARQQQEQIAVLEGIAEQNMDHLGVPKDDAVRDWIVSRAVALPATPEGHPNVEAAYQEFQQLIDSQKKQWASTKRTQHFAPGGGEGTQAPDLSTHSGRVQHMLSRLQSDEGLA